MRYAMVPPRQVKMPTLRRSGVKAGFSGAGCQAAAVRGKRAPAAAAVTEVTRNSRRVTGIRNLRRYSTLQTRMFSSRLPDRLGPNAFSRALEDLRRAGTPLLDLTE